MKKYHVRVILTAALALVLSACQALFTYSPLSGFQRDPADMTADQQVAYAEDLIANGSPADMLEVLPLIEAQIAADPTNTDLLLLGADLALGGSGLEQGLSEAIAAFAADPANPPDPAVILDLIAGMNEAALQTAADYIADAYDNVLDPSEISQEQYINAVLAIIVVNVVGSGVTDLADFDINDPADMDPDDYVTMTEYLTASGMTEEDFLAMMGM